MQTAFPTDEKTMTAFENCSASDLHSLSAADKRKNPIQDRAFSSLFCKDQCVIIIRLLGKVLDSQLIALNAIALDIIPNDHSLVGSINLNLFYFLITIRLDLGQLASSS